MFQPVCFHFVLIFNVHKVHSVYEAFRFAESYGVIFQCNVKYCLGPCEPVRIKPLHLFSFIYYFEVNRAENYSWFHKLQLKWFFCEIQAVCTYGRENFESWGRKKREIEESREKRAISEEGENIMSLSREIIVLDFGDETNNPYDDFEVVPEKRGGNFK